MTQQKNEQTSSAKNERPEFYQEFEALPLDKKFASLFKMEAATLEEAFHYVVNTSMKAVEKAGDAINEFGAKIQNDAKRATAPEPPKPQKDASTKDTTAKQKPRASGPTGSNPKSKS